MDRFARVLQVHWRTSKCWIRIIIVSCEFGSKKKKKKPPFYNNRLAPWVLYLENKNILHWCTFKTGRKAGKTVPVV